MCSLADHKDLIPYLEILIPELQNILTDPIPDVRTVSAKGTIMFFVNSFMSFRLFCFVPRGPIAATYPMTIITALGTLVQGIGEQNFSTLIPWLLETMHSDAGSVERTGAAQGLSEVIAGLGTLPALLNTAFVRFFIYFSRAHVCGLLTSWLWPGAGVGKFEELLPQIMDGTDDPKWHIREGYIGLFVYLPSALKEKFPPYMGTLLPAILKGLADETGTHHLSHTSFHLMTPETSEFLLVVVPPHNRICS